MQTARRRQGWRRVVLVGCGGILAVGAGLGTLLALNWERIRAIYGSVSSTFTELQAVRSAVQSTFKTDDVFVQKMHRLGVPAPILVVQLVNPPFLKELPDEGLRAKAVEVATIARSACSSSLAFDNYEIVFVSKHGFGVTLSYTRRFALKAADLPQHSDKGLQ
jgi:hypothetical protein